MMVTDARLHRKSQKKAKLFHETLFLLQFSYKYTVRKKSVNGTSGPPPSQCLGNCRSIPLAQISILTQFSKSKPDSFKALAVYLYVEVTV